MVQSESVAFKQENMKSIPATHIHKKRKKISKGGGKHLKSSSEKAEIGVFLVIQADWGAPSQGEMLSPNTE